ncbi:unnamed protein product [Leuciscus chuanchicus]
MFAYVHYLDDGVKDVVNVKDIKHFDPKNTTDFSSHTYWILQKGRFIKGQILLLKETCEEIENVLATGKRIRVPKLLDKSPPENKTSERKEAKDNAVNIGEGVVIHRDKWRKIQLNVKDSLFVKELAVCIWGTSKLANRSLEGKSCPTTKSDPRPPLTPHKVRTLQSCFQKWLEGKHLEEAELKARTVKLGRYVTEKIQDINKKVKNKAK